MLNPFHPSVAFHIETSHLICTTNQMTDFYMKFKAGLKWVNLIYPTSNNRRYLATENQSKILKQTSWTKLMCKLSPSMTLYLQS